MCNGAICGGIIGESKLFRDLKKDGFANMMAFVMPDHILNLYKKYRHSKDEIDKMIADHLFERYAWSQI